MHGCGVLGSGVLRGGAATYCITLPRRVWGEVAYCYQLPSFISVRGEREGDSEESHVGQDWPLKEGVQEMRVHG